MNAQEAIEKEEKALVFMKGEAEKYKQLAPNDKYGQEIQKAHIEALSIVLESAKHLHMYIAVVEKKGAFIETFTHEGFKLVPFMTMTAEVAKRIGIEEGDNK